MSLRVCPLCGSSLDTNKAAHLELCLRRLMTRHREQVSKHAQVVARLKAENKDLKQRLASDRGVPVYVYYLRNRCGEVIRIGHTEDLKNRFKSYRYDARYASWRDEIDWSTVKWVALDGLAAAVAFEKAEIGRLNPRHNAHHRTDSGRPVAAVAS